MSLECLLLISCGKFPKIYLTKDIKITIHHEDDDDDASADVLLKTENGSYGVGGKQKGMYKICN